MRDNFQIMKDCITDNIKNNEKYIDRIKNDIESDKQTLKILNSFESHTINIFNIISHSWANNGRFSIETLQEVQKEINGIKFDNTLKDIIK